MGKSKSEPVKREIITVEEARRRLSESGFAKHTLHEWVRGDLRREGLWCKDCVEWIIKPLEGEYGSRPPARP